MPPVEPQAADLVLELAQVRKAYAEGEHEREVFRGIDLRVPRGERLVLLGRSGSGKSTLLHLACGIELASSGRVHLLGQDLSALDEAARTRLRRDHVGFVFQFFHLIPTLSVLENLHLPLELAGRLDRAGRARALELLARVGLADRAKSAPDRLSGGEQQRVAVARALVHAPRLLLADEPTGNLDEETAAQVLALVDELVREDGRTLIVATHSPEWLPLADRVLEVHEGRLCARAGGA